MTAIDYLKVCIYILILITNAYLFVYNWFGKDPTNDGNTFRLIWRDKRQAQLYAQVNVMTRLICWRLSYGDMADGIFEDIFDTHGLSGSLAEELDLYEFYAMAEIDPYGERVAELASKFEKRLCQGGYFAEDLRCELGIASMIRHFANNDRRIDDTSGLNTHSTADRELLKNLLFRSVYDEGPKTEEELRDKISDCKWSSRSIIHYGQWRSVLRTFLKVREGYIEVNKKDSKEKDETVEEG